MRKSKLIVIVGLVPLLAAACGSSSPKTTTHPKPTGSKTTKPTVTIKSATIKPYGTVLVNSDGHALYVFSPDKARQVTCVSTCAKVWPPLAQPSDAKLAASGEVKASLLSADHSPDGTRVVTYNHWPLYTYTADTAPGVAHGQALKLNGGFWYLMSPTGAKVTHKAKSSSSSSGYKY